MGSATETFLMVARAPSQGNQQSSCHQLFRLLDFDQDGLQVPGNWLNYGSWPAMKENLRLCRLGAVSS